MRARVHFSARKFLQAEAVTGWTALDSQQRGITNQSGVIPKDAASTQQQRPTVTLTRHASNHKVHQLHLRNIRQRESWFLRALFPINFPPPPPRPHTLSPTPRDYCIVRCNFVDESEWWGKYIWDLVPTGVDYSVIGVDIFRFFSLLGPHGARFYLVWKTVIFVWNSTCRTHTEIGTVGYLSSERVIQDLTSRVVISIWNVYLMALRSVTHARTHAHT